MIWFVFGISATLKSAMSGSPSCLSSPAIPSPAESTSGYPILIASRYGAQAYATASAFFFSVTSRARIRSGMGQPLHHGRNEDRQGDGRIAVHGHGLCLFGDLAP